MGGEGGLDLHDLISNPDASGPGPEEDNVLLVVVHPLHLGGRDEARCNDGTSPWR